MRRRIRGLLPPLLKRSYHRHVLRRDFGIEPGTGRRRPSRLDPTLPRGLNIVGWFDSPTGVGQSVRALARAAEAAGLPVTKLEAASLERGPHVVGPYGVNLFHINADGAGSVVELCGPDLHRGRANVGYWYWETEDFPERWRDRFAYFDEIWVASEFCRAAVAKKSSIPVAIVPPPVLLEEVRSSLGLPAREEVGFRFLTIADAASVPERKNPLGAVRAFARAFPADSSVSLTVKIANAETASGLVGELRNAAGSARVEVDDSRADRSDVERLLAACDAYVSLHRSEGFGLPLAEAMLLGKPVAATDYSGSRDFLDETTGFPIRWRPIALERTLGPYDAGTRWAEPDQQHTVETLRRIIDDRDEAGRRAQAARRRIGERYGLETSARLLAEELDRLVARLAARP